MRLNTKISGIVIITVILFIVAVSGLVSADAPTDFKTNEEVRLSRTLTGITPLVQRQYCLPRIADLAEKKSLRTQLGESIEVEQAKIERLQANCVGEFIKVFQ